MSGGGGHIGGGTAGFAIGNVSVNDGMAVSGVSNVGNQSYYTPPKGGGGVTSQIIINGVKVTFGHGGRHWTSSDYSVSDIERAIANDVVLQPAVYTKVGKFIININGHDIEYHYRTLSGNWINVGTYFELN